MKHPQQPSAPPPSKRPFPPQDGDAAFRALFEASLDAIVVADDHGCYIDANAAACELFGLPRERLLGRHLSDFARASHVHATTEQFHNFRQNRGERGDFTLQRADGTTLILEYCATANFLPGQHVSFLRDVTERHRAEQAQRHAHEQAAAAKDALSHSLEALTTLNTLVQAIAAELDLRQLAQLVTDAATRLSGAAFGAFFYSDVDDKGVVYPLYALSGAPPETFSSFPMPRKTEIFGPTFSGSGIVRSGDITEDPRYGKNPPYRGMPAGHLPVRSYLAVPVLSRSGQSIGGLFLGHPEADVFAQREEDLVKALAAHAAIATDNARLYQKAKEAIRTRDEFLSIASHELKTPLTPLKLQIQGMRRALGRGGLADMAPARIDKMLVGADQQITRITRLVDDLLDVARISAHRFTLNRELLDLGELAGDVLERYRSECENARCPVTFSAPAPVQGHWDRLRLEQVIINLLSNALKYAPGTRIEVAVRLHQGKAVLSIRDHGAGLTEKDLRRIFERFERVGSPRNVGGLGLGLFIARQIVEAHGGEIRVESQLGAGCTFTVTVPRDAAA